MLTCKALTQQHASDYLDHELTSRQRFVVRVHLMLCRHCRRFLTQLKVVRGVLRDSPPVAIESEMKATAERLHEFYHEQNKS